MEAVTYVQQYSQLLARIPRASWLADKSQPSKKNPQSKQQQKFGTKLNPNNEIPKNNEN